MSADNNKETSSSLFYIDKNGRKTDVGLHDDEPAYPELYHEMNVQRAIRDGMSEASARRDYGYKGKK